MTTAATLPVSREVSLHRVLLDGPTRGLIELGLVVGLVLLAASLLTPAPPVATELRSVATVVDAHAATMAARGDVGVDDVRALAAHLRTAARTLGDEPEQYANATSSRLLGYAVALRADGTAMVQHGRAMGDTGLMSAGQRVLSVVGYLEARGEQLRTVTSR